MAANVDIACVTCGQIAAHLIFDAQQNTENYYCRADSPLSPSGEVSPRFRLKRWRLGPGNALSARLRMPQQSEEHQGFRIEMCELHMIGGSGASQYYLSMITGVDQFELWHDEFEQNLLDYVVSQTSPAARQFFEPLQTGMFLADFMQLQFERSQGKDPRPSKQVIAIELLLNHPDWSDERIAANVPTTMKQLARMSNFNALRRVPIRMAARKTAKYE